MNAIWINAKTCILNEMRRGPPADTRTVAFSGEACGIIATEYATDPTFDEQLVAAGWRPAVVRTLLMRGQQWLDTQEHIQELRDE
jgi:hypothetical protein